MQKPPTNPLANESTTPTPTLQSPRATASTSPSQHPACRPSSQRPGPRGRRGRPRPRSRSKRTERRRGRATSDRLQSGAYWYNTPLRNPCDCANSPGAWHRRLMLPCIPSIPLMKSSGSGRGSTSPVIAGCGQADWPEKGMGIFVGTGATWRHTVWPGNSLTGASLTVYGSCIVALAVAIRDAYVLSICISELRWTTPATRGL